ncbi:MAG: EAL domain-containing protein [Leptospirillia bacterium]
MRTERDDLPAEPPLLFHPETAYGNEARALLSCLSPDPAVLEMAVVSFYRLLLESPEGREVLSSLSPREFDHLKSRQADYLARLLSADLDLVTHRSMARVVGLHHWAFGVPLSLLSRGSDLYERALAVALSGLSANDVLPLKNILTRRISVDLSLQSAIYGERDRQRTERLESMERESSSAATEEEVLAEILPTLLDPRTGGILLLDPLTASLRVLGSAGVLPRLDNSLLLSWLNMVLDKLLLEDVPDIRISVDEEEFCPEEIRAGFGEEGLRSMGAFVVFDRLQRPQKILILFGWTPLAFRSVRDADYWRRASAHLGQALIRLEETRFRSTPPSPEAGHRFRRLLGGEALVMHYQPIVDPSTGKIVKTEALARLVSEGSIHSPAEFLPVFGRRQLRTLFDRGLSRILSDMERLGEDPPPCQMNLPTEILEDLDWLSSLPDRLADMGISPRRIGFEILESALVDDGRILRALMNLKERGYSLLLDDVGSGESSLLRMVTLPVDGIKIDQAFVRPLARGFGNLDMILSLTMLALQRGLSCVAEGVETEGIVDALGSVRNILLQGYAVARPMTAEALSRWTPSPESGVGGHFPHTLYGWYSRHISRLFGIFNALNTISDVIDSHRLEDGEQCPLHNIILPIGGDLSIVEAHLKWHRNYARFVEMARNGVSPQDLWPEMQRSRRILQGLVEKRLFAREGGKGEG